MKKYLVTAILVSLLCLPGIVSANLHVLTMTSAVIVSNVCDENAVIDVEWWQTGCEWGTMYLFRKLGSSGNWTYIGSPTYRDRIENRHWDDLYECWSGTEYFEETDVVDRDYGYIYYKACNSSTGNGICTSNIVNVFLGCDAPPER